MELQSCVMDEGSVKAENAIHEFFIAVTQMQYMLSNMNPVLFYDLQKYHPEAWMLFKSFKEESMHKIILNNINRGKAEGYYRNNVNVDIMAKMRVDQVDYILFQNAFSGSKYSMLQVMTELTEHFMYGLCTIEGHKLIDSYKKINEE